MFTQFLRTQHKCFVRSSFSLSKSRTFHSSRKSLIGAHDIFEQRPADVNIQGYNEDGFQIEGCDVYYTLFILPKLSLLWNVPSVEMLTPQHFSILEIIQPIGLFNFTNLEKITKISFFFHFCRLIVSRLW